MDINVGIEDALAKMKIDRYIILTTVETIHSHSSNSKLNNNEQGTEGGKNRTNK